VDVDFTPEYPFGFGLSYSNFEYTNLRISRATLRTGQRLTVSADITNQGPYEAVEIIQFYIHRVAASVAQPVRELKGFTRMHLRVGEKKTASYNLDSADLAFYRSTSSNRTELANEPGKIEVWIGSNSSTGLPGSFTLE
jgi:beta-glucosidase